MSPIYISEDEEYNYADAEAPKRTEEADTHTSMFFIKACFLRYPSGAQQTPTTPTSEEQASRAQHIKAYQSRTVVGTDFSGSEGFVGYNCQSWPAEQ